MPCCRTPALCPGERAPYGGRAVLRGFTLLEMLVATLVMGIAVVGLLSNLATSMRNAARLTEHDRAVVLARQKMEELLLDTQLPLFTLLEGEFDPAVIGGIPTGWRARLTPFDMPPNAAPAVPVLERIELEVWWGEGTARRSLSFEAFRRGVLTVQGGAPPR